MLRYDPCQSSKAQRSRDIRQNRCHSASYPNINSVQEDSSSFGGLRHQAFTRQCSGNNGILECWNIDIGSFFLFFHCSKVPMAISLILSFGNEGLAHKGKCFLDKSGNRCLISFFTTPNTPQFGTPCCPVCNGHGDFVLTRI